MFAGPAFGGCGCGGDRPRPETARVQPGPRVRRRRRRRRGRRRRSRARGWYQRGYPAGGQDRVWVARRCVSFYFRMGNWTDDVVFCLLYTDPTDAKFSECFVAHFELELDDPRGRKSLGAGDKWSALRALHASLVDAVGPGTISGLGRGSLTIRGTGEPGEFPPPAPPPLINLVRLFKFPWHSCTGD